MLSKVEDLKYKRSVYVTFFEEILAKKPFTKQLTFLLLSGGLQFTQLSQQQDSAKVARECLKALSSEDLKQLYLSEAKTMATYEARYTNISG